MNVVAMHSLKADSRTFPAIDYRMARIEIFDQMTAAKPVWRALEQAQNLATPYQSYEFLKHWQLYVGSATGVTPCIVVGFNSAGAPLFLWPLGIRRLAGFRVAEFLGGKHANFNMALWRRDAVALIDAEALRAVLARIAARADIARLTNQPLAWAGITNPLALLPHQRSASFAFSGALMPDFESLLRANTNANARKKMRKKERTLASFGAVRFWRASGAHDAHRALDVFFKQKSARMRMRGVPDVFAAPGVRRFLEAAATEPSPGGGPPIEIYTLSVGDLIVATMGGIVRGGRFCAMFNSIAPDRYASESPGEQLIVNLVRACCERGLKTFDLGIGEAHYKGLFCGDTEPLFDSYLPLSGAGRPLAAGLATAAAIKRAVRQQPVLWSTVSMARRLAARLAGAN